MAGEIDFMNQQNAQQPGAEAAREDTVIQSVDEASGETAAAVANSPAVEATEAEAEPTPESEPAAIEAEAEPTPESEPAATDAKAEPTPE